MEYTFSLQKLAAYKPRNSAKSKATYDAGLVLLERGAYAKKGEEGARIHRGRHRSRMLKVLATALYAQAGMP